MTLHFFAPCPRGLEPSLAEEVQEIGGRTASALPGAALRAGEVVPGGVHFDADHIGAAYAVNLHSRLASRVLLRVAEAPYRSEDDIYALARRVDWAKWMRPGQTLRVDLTATRSPLKSLNFATLRIKDGICDQLRERSGQRPDIDTARPDVRVFGYLSAERCTLYLDTSGEPLFKRGWRLEKGEAPLKENLAAGILRLAGWTPALPLYDPMCGSGTFLIEAAQIALGIAPGAQRRFAFEQLAGFDGKAWQALRTDAARGALPAAEAAKRLHERLAGSDISGDMIAIARANWQRAGLPGEAPLKQVDARHARPPFAAAGLMLLNPPYGERIAVRGRRPGAPAAPSAPEARPDAASNRPAARGAPAARVRMAAPAPEAEAPLDPEAEREADAFGATFAATLKQHYAGWTVVVLSADQRLPNRMRLKPSRRTPLFNGAIECRLFRFEMVAGSARPA